MTILDGGYVGIGTITPSGPFHVMSGRNEILCAGAICGCRRTALRLTSEMAGGSLHRSCQGNRTWYPVGHARIAHQLCGITEPGLVLCGARSQRVRGERYPADPRGHRNGLRRLRRRADAAGFPRRLRLHHSRQRRRFHDPLRARAPDPEGLFCPPGFPAASGIQLSCSRAMVPTPRLLDRSGKPVPVRHPKRHFDRVRPLQAAVAARASGSRCSAVPPGTC